MPVLIFFSPWVITAPPFISAPVPEAVTTAPMGMGGKLRISLNPPAAWKKLSYTLLWRGQKLNVTVTPSKRVLNPFFLRRWLSQNGFPCHWKILHRK
ncbi:hypothetical protein D1646_11425 [Pseudoflavonifractor sp. 60]|nr:hypothetical protein [Pseudoflavonifractor sp. 60]